MDETLSVQTLECACSLALRQRARSPFGAFLVAHFAARAEALGVAVEARVAEAQAYYSATAGRYEAALRRALDGFRAALADALNEAAEPADPPPARRAARSRSTEAEIARLEARLEELKRRQSEGGDDAAMDDAEDDSGEEDAMDDGEEYGGAAVAPASGGAPAPMDEDSDDEEPDPFGYAAGEVFEGAGRRLDSAPPDTSAAEAAAAVEEEKARAAADAEAARRKDVADKRAAFLARLG
mmetsp:Transcript_8827/g.26533  ORF Transcript_8827/g.26533 Transcript_8827/m.26533 type:complete len:240 (-) Transcript_8827:73-792(-)